MRKAALLIAVLLVSVCAYSQVRVFSYGNECFCSSFDRLMERVEKKYHEVSHFCYLGNPYSSGDILQFFAKYEPSIVFFPRPLIPFFGPRAPTGGLLDITPVREGVYAGIWAGARDKRGAKKVLKAIVKRASLLECWEYSASVVPSGWWAQQLANTSYRERRTPVSSPISGVRAEIRRYLYEGYPQKAFVAYFDHKVKVLSTLDGFKKVRAVGNVYLYPALWGKGCSVSSLRRKVSRKLKIKEKRVALLFTGADMDNIAFATERFRDVVVWAAVTAGVLGNAMRAGVDRGNWFEVNGRWEKVGTINIIVFVNRKLSEAAYAQAIIRVTEAKSAVLQELGVKSTYSPWVIATGTGTDNVIVASLGKEPSFSSCGGHTKLAELMAKAVRKALFRAIYLQNGLRLREDGKRR
ncbi:MAG: adenosylcobinamide amidohydrolase [Deferribacteres bacterium]|nr:adenosylcobinamide amidohydrolase [Deferribacteres bacterium]